MSEQHKADKRITEANKGDVWDIQIGIVHQDVPEVPILHKTETFRNENDALDFIQGQLTEWYVSRSNDAHNCNGRFDLDEGVLPDFKSLAWVTCVTANSGESIFIVAIDDHTIRQKKLPYEDGIVYNWGENYRELYLN